MSEYVGEGQGRLNEGGRGSVVGRHRAVPLPSRRKPFNIETVTSTQSFMAHRVFQSTSLRQSSAVLRSGHPHAPGGTQSHGQPLGQQRNSLCPGPGPKVCADEDQGRAYPTPHSAVCPLTKPVPTGPLLHRLVWVLALLPVARATALGTGSFCSFIPKLGKRLELSPSQRMDPSAQPTR